MNKRFVLGISGFIASGKSEAGRFFYKSGADYISADDVVNDLYEPDNDGWRKISGYFGKEFILKSGKINRNKLARFVFSDGHKLKILNGLIHPLVTDAIGKLIVNSRKELIVVEASYFEKGKLLDLVDKILWIECGRSKLKRRAIKNNGITGQMFEQIISVQGRPARVDYIVDNNGTKAALFKQLRGVLETFEVPGTSKVE